MPIVVDGLLSEWSGANSAQFRGLSNGATAYALWDASNLYVAFQVTDSQLNATQTARDAGNLYRDDTVEIYIDTTNERAPMMQRHDYQLLVNLSNVQGDLRGTGSGKDAAWNGAWRSAVKVQGTPNSNGDTDASYTVEVAVPWSEIGVSPSSGRSMGMDLTVDDQDASAFDYFDWAGIAPDSYAQPNKWKVVQLSNTAPAPPPSDLTALQPRGPVTLDGVLNEWGGATPIQFNGVSNNATSYLMWDATNLYVAFQLTDRQLAAIQTARDAVNLYRDDTVEIYIDTVNERANKMQLHDFQFLVNLNNIQGDLRGTGSGKDAAWNGAWRSAVKMQGTPNSNGDTDASYTVEVALPWSEIGVSPSSGRSMGMDLTVDDQDASAFDYFDWAGIAPDSYAQPNKWKVVQLSNTAPAPPPSDLTALQPRGPVTLDGVLNEWGGATPIQFNGVSNNATSYLMWDATNLYVAFQLTDRQLAAIQTARDAVNLYRDDTVEIYIDTVNERANKMQLHDFQFLVNLNNIQGDLRGTGSGKDAAWNGAWRSAVKMQGTPNSNGDTDTGYVVEVAIPWSQMGVTPGSGQRVAMDLTADDSDPTGNPAFDYFDWAGIAPAPYAMPSKWKVVLLK